MASYLNVQKNFTLLGFPETASEGKIGFKTELLPTRAFGKMEKTFLEDNNSLQHTIGEPMAVVSVVILWW